MITIEKKGRFDEEVEMLRCTYIRKIVRDFPTPPSKGKADLFFVYIHVTGYKRFVDDKLYLKTGKISMVTERIDREERLIHYHMPSEQIPLQHRGYQQLQDGEWLCELTYEEYERLINPNITDDLAFILYKAKSEGDHN